VVWSNDHASDEPPFWHATFDYPLGCTVLDIAVPHIPPAVGLYNSISTPQIFRQHVVVAVACSDFAVRVLQLPLDSASPTGQILASISQNSVPTSVSLSWTNGSDDEMGTEQDDVDNSQLIVAACSRESLGSIHFACVSISQGRTKHFQTLKLSEVPLKLEFNPSSHTSNHHSKLLIACSAGLVYVYDPFSHPDGDTEEQTLPSRGTWLGLYSTKFTADEDELSSVSAQRKRILDASWASNGRSIIVLLADGEWGVWSMPSRSEEGVSHSSSFALWGMVGSGMPSHMGQGPKKSLDRSSLPTMTPNTRRVKETNLFVGQTTTATGAPRGGLSVNPVLLPSADNTEDSVVLFYNDTVCYVDSLQSYWSRAARRSSEIKMQTAGGSLFGPGLTRIENLNLNGQRIMSVGQITSQQKGVVLLSCEHQIVISSHATQTPLASARTTTLAARPRSDLRRSQALLDKGELDIDQLDVLMDQMDGDGTKSQGVSGSSRLLESQGPFMSGALPRPGA
jgi:hypothetical protein